MAMSRWLFWLTWMLTNCTVSPTRHDAIQNVARWGVIGDGFHDDTQAMQHAISSAAPHSVIVIPADRVVITGPLTLHSDLTLRVDGKLQAVDITPSLLELDGWPKLPPLVTHGDSSDGGHILQYQALLYASNVTNLRITGTGIIDGRGERWWQAFLNKDPMLQAGRPNLIQIVNSTFVQIDSVTLQDAPFWTLHPVLSQSIYIHHITLRSRLYAPNVDGIDPDSCRHVLIEFNDISCGDDHVAIKAGICGGKSSPNKCTDPVWSSGLYQSENITVRYNTLRTGMGITVGSETSGGVRNVWIHDNVIGLCETGHDTGGCGWGPALHLKTTLSRGGVVENVVFKDNVVYNTSMFILLEMNYQQTGEDEVPSDYPPTTVQNIRYLENRALGSATAASFSCSVHHACCGISVVEQFHCCSGQSNALELPLCRILQCNWKHPGWTRRMHVQFHESFECSDCRLRDICTDSIYALRS